MDRTKPDILILFSVLALVGIGIVMVYSTSSIYASERLGDGAYFIKRHLVALCLGLVVMAIAAFSSEKMWWFLSYPFIGLALVSLLLVLLSPLGRTMGGSSRWLKLGPFGFQPAEFTKLAIVLYLSRSFVNKGEKIRTFDLGLLPHVLVSGVIVFLVCVQPDFGTAMVIAGLSVLMMFAAGVRVSHLASLAIPAVPMIYALVMGVDYRRRRILAFLDPWNHAQDSAFQLIQSLLAFGSGGLLGQGLGKGRQKLFYLPEAHTDFIFSCIGEEIGLLGVLLVVGLFSLLLWRGIRASLRSQSKFSSYVALGSTLLIVIQALVNMWVALGIFPTKGLPLPFVSYGGTSLVVNLMAAGIILSVSRGKSSSGRWRTG